MIEFHDHQEYGTTASTPLEGIEVKTVLPGTARAATLRQFDATLGTVVLNDVLTVPEVPVKRHIGLP